MPLDGHPWFDNGYADWLVQCELRRRELSSALRADLHLPEDQGQRFLSARIDRAEGLPVHSGYWSSLLALDRL